MTLDPETPESRDGTVYRVLVSQGDGLWREVGDEVVAGNDRVAKRTVLEQVTDEQVADGVAEKGDTVAVPIRSWNKEPYELKPSRGREVKLG